MGSTASGLNSLASTTVIDIYKRLIKSDKKEGRYLAVSRGATVVWGIFCIIMALYASKLGNLIEAVNILGSLFYGTILGVFIVAFYLKRVEGNAAFWAAVVTEVVVILVWIFTDLAFLWLNVVGCVLVAAIALMLQLLSKKSLSSQSR
jgi:Na+/proline symporter